MQIVSFQIAVGKHRSGVIHLQPIELLKNNEIFNALCFEVCIWIGIVQYI